MEKKKAPKGQKEVSITVNIICDNDLQVKVDSDTPQDQQQLLLFPDVVTKHEPMIATKKAHVLSWLREISNYKWSSGSAHFTKTWACATLHMTPAEFTKALWCLREDGLIAYFYRRSFRDYVLTSIEKGAAND